MCVQARVLQSNVGEVTEPLVALQLCFSSSCRAIIPCTNMTPSTRRIEPKQAGSIPICMAAAARRVESYISEYRHAPEGIQTTLCPSHEWELEQVAPGGVVVELL